MIKKLINRKYFFSALGTGLLGAFVFNKKTLTKIIKAPKKNIKVSINPDSIKRNNS